MYIYQQLCRVFLGLRFKGQFESPPPALWQPRGESFRLSEVPLLRRTRGRVFRRCPRLRGPRAVTNLLANNRGSARQQSREVSQPTCADSRKFWINPGHLRWVPDSIRHRPDGTTPEVRRGYVHAPGQFAINESWGCRSKQPQETVDWQINSSPGCGI